MPRRLPIPTSPAAGEALPSYVDRVSARLRWQRGTVIDWTGIVPPEARWRLWSYGITMSPQQIESFAYSTQLETTQVEQMLLVSLGRGALGIAGDLPRRHRRWAYFSGSNACPACLAATGAWQLRWKMPWFFACTKHNCLAIGHCPGCGQRTGASTRLRAGDHIAFPGSCVNLQRPARPGGRGTPCPFLLRDLTPHKLGQNSSILEAQRILDQILEGEPLTIGNSTLIASEVLDDLQFLVTLILNCATTNELELQEPWAVTAFEEWRTRHAPRTRPCLTPYARDGAFRLDRHEIPTDPKLLAAVTITALPLLLAPDTDRLAERLATFGPRLIANDVDANGHVRIGLPTSPRVRAGLLTALRRLSKSTAPSRRLADAEAA